MSNKIGDGPRVLTLQEALEMERGRPIHNHGLGEVCHVNCPVHPMYAALAKDKFDPSKVQERREKTSAERKAEPIHSGVLMYFPDALAAVSRVSKAGNDKHNPGEPLHWARGKSMDQMDCLARHTLTPDAIDPDSGEVELAHAAWRCLAQLQLIEEKRLAAAGIMPYSGITP